MNQSRKPAKSRLDALLVTRGLAETLAQAQRCILAGQVFIGDARADKPGHQVPVDAAVRIQATLRYVSRGGLKLEAALAAFQIDPTGWVCADIGASTGGFTDCLLQRGAARVYAVDVGYGQLAWSLRTDPRVISLERANIRHLTALPEAVALATVDVSFIGLAMTLPHIAALLTPAGQVVALIKPQFEVAKGQVGKGGVIRDPQLHRAAIEKALTAAVALGLAPAGLIRSPLTGPAGNVEFLAWLRRGSENPPGEVVAGWLAGCLS